MYNDTTCQHDNGDSNVRESESIYLITIHEMIMLPTSVVTTCRCDPQNTVRYFVQSEGHDTDHRDPRVEA